MSKSTVPLYRGLEQVMPPGGIEPPIFACHESTSATLYHLAKEALFDNCAKLENKAFIYSKNLKMVGKESGGENTR
jgi:hypothetical protein